MHGDAGLGPLGGDSREELRERLGAGVRREIGSVEQQDFAELHLLLRVAVV